MLTEFLERALEFEQLARQLVALSFSPLHLHCSAVHRKLPSGLA
jgi:hypothetical protein